MTSSRFERLHARYTRKSSQQSNHTLPSSSLSCLHSIKANLDQLNSTSASDKQPQPTFRDDNRSENFETGENQFSQSDISETESEALVDGDDLNQDDNNIMWTDQAAQTNVDTYNDSTLLNGTTTQTDTMALTEVTTYNDCTMLGEMTDKTALTEVNTYTQLGEMTDVATQTEVYARDDGTQLNDDACSDSTQLCDNLWTDRAAQTFVDTTCTETGTQTEPESFERVDKANSKFSIASIEGNDKATRFYTGLPTWVVFLHLYMFLSPFMYTVNHSHHFVNVENELLLVLMKLRLNLKVEDLAYRFGIAQSTVCRICQRWLDVMYKRLRFLIHWPERDILWQNMPESFKQLYPRCACTIDCSEIFIDTPTEYKARAQTYSNYKKKQYSKISYI